MIYHNNIPYCMSVVLEQGSGSGSGSGAPLPTTLENMTDGSEWYYCDNTWLPAFKAINGVYYVGALGKASEIWNLFRTVWLETSDIPAVWGPGEWSGMTNAEQIYINNLVATDGGEDARVAEQSQYNTYVCTAQDARGDWCFNSYFKTGSTVISWTPNGYADYGGPMGANGIHVICASRPSHIEGVFEGRKPLKIYANTEFLDYIDQYPDDYQAWYDNWADLCTPFTYSESQWLDNYFTIVQNGQTLGWYDSVLENIYGKYLILSHNNSVVAEIPYWKEDKLYTNIGTNMTASTVTKTGTVTYNGVTKSYSITQDPISYTMKAKFTKIITDDVYGTGGFNVQSIWPFRCDGWMWDENEQAKFKYLISCIKRIRIYDETASPLQWREWNMADPDTGLDRIFGYNWDSAMREDHVWMPWVFMLDPYTWGGTHHSKVNVEWCIENVVLGEHTGTDFSGNTRTFNVSGQDVEPCVHPLVAYDDGLEHSWDPSTSTVTNYQDFGGVINEMQAETDWCISSACSEQLSTSVRLNAANEWPRFIPLSIGGSAMNRSLKTIQLDNLKKINEWIIGEERYPYVTNVIINGTFENNVSNLINNDGWDGKTTIWYNSTSRSPFDYEWAGTDGWFLNVHGVEKLYLHPTIYAMTNHGFNDEVTGWESGVLDDWVNNGGEIYELPNNWKTLVPNIIPD
jgi:hypothetical protein